MLLVVAALSAIQSNLVVFAIAVAKIIPLGNAGGGCLLSLAESNVAWMNHRQREFRSKLAFAAPANKENSRT